MNNNRYVANIADISGVQWVFDKGKQLLGIFKNLFNFISVFCPRARYFTAMLPKWTLSHVVRSGRNAGAGSDIGKCSRRWSRHAGGRNDRRLVGYPYCVILKFTLRDTRTEFARCWNCNFLSFLLCLLHDKNEENTKTEFKFIY